MDSLVANYASSDEDDETRDQFPPSQFQVHEESTQSEGKGNGGPKCTSKRVDLFKLMPPPKSSVVDSPPRHGGMLRNLPPPKSSVVNSPPKLESPSALPKPRSDTKETEEISKSKPVFSLLPQPKSSSGASKKVVQFKLPTIASSAAADDESYDDGDKGEIGKQENSVFIDSPGAFLSSMPLPKQSATLRTASSAMGSSRRYVIETDNSNITSKSGTEHLEEGAISNVESMYEKSNTTSYDTSTWIPGNESLPGFDYFGVHHQSSDLETYGGYDVDAGDGNVVYPEGDTYMDPNVGSFRVADYSYGNAESTTDFETYGYEYGDFASSYSADDQAPLPESSGLIENAAQALGKRGRKDIAPSEIIEVKQEELMKNRPREDQAKLTGIAFGPAYQPASAKGKPSKLHKRKHQIGTLYFDMKQKSRSLRRDELEVL